MKARDVMTSPVVTVPKSATVAEVANILVSKRISAVPVVDAAGKLVGIVSEGDLLHRVEAGTERTQPWWLQVVSGDRPLAADYVKSHATRVADVMTKEVKSTDPETPLKEIAELLEKCHIKRVPIVNKEGELVGIVSRANIIQAIASANQKLEANLSDTAIRDKLLEELNKQPWAHTYRLNVTVSNGVVDLWGMVESETERKAILVAAELIPGVTTVNDHLLRQTSFAY